MSVVHFESVAAARANLKQVLDAATQGRAATITRDDTTFAVLDGERLRRALALLVAARAELVPEGGGWSVILPGLPIAADGNSLDEALEDAVAALREYAEDWNTHLRLAPNHEDNWGLVQFIGLSSDEQLLAWLNGV